LSTNFAVFSSSVTYGRCSAFVASAGNTRIYNTNNTHGLMGSLRGFFFPMLYAYTNENQFRYCL